MDMEAILESMVTKYNQLTESASGYSTVLAQYNSLIQSGVSANDAAEMKQQLYDYYQVFLQIDAEAENFTQEQKTKYANLINLIQKLKTIMSANNISDANNDIGGEFYSSQEAVKALLAVVAQGRVAFKELGDGAAGAGDAVQKAMN
jgi:hypothetical protein